MSRMDALAEERIPVSEVFGQNYTTEAEFIIIDASIASIRQNKKAADFAIRMFSRLFDPNSDSATPDEKLDIPVVIGAPRQVIGDKGENRQLDIFFRVAREMFKGRNLDFSKELRMPYRPEILPVAVSPDGQRSIVGQYVMLETLYHPNKSIIPNAEIAVQNLTKIDPESLTSFLDTNVTHVSVFAHADKGSSLFSLAQKNFITQQRLQRQIDMLPFPIA